MSFTIKFTDNAFKTLEATKNFYTAELESAIKFRDSTKREFRTSLKDDDRAAQKAIILIGAIADVNSLESKVKVITNIYNEVVEARKNAKDLVIEFDDDELENFNIKEDKN